MSKAKLEAARELIKDKQYAEARAILRTMPKDPTAQRWLTKLDEIAPEVEFPSERKSSAAGFVLGLFSLLAFVAAVFSVLFLLSDPDFLNALYVVIAVGLAIVFRALRARMG